MKDDYHQVELINLRMLTFHLSAIRYLASEASFRHRFLESVPILKLIMAIFITCHPHLDIIYSSYPKLSIILRKKTSKKGTIIRDNFKDKLVHARVNDKCLKGFSFQISFEIL